MTQKDLLRADIEDDLTAVAFDGGPRENRVVEALRLAIRMRGAQKTFYSSRSRSNLEAALTLERRFDELAR